MRIEYFIMVDRIRELSIEKGIVVCESKVPVESSIYQGHFPGHPILPGVLLIEAMAQTGVVALGIYLVGSERGRDEVRRVLTVFTDVTAEFSGVVKPGDTVTISARKVFFRMMKLRSEVRMTKADGTLVASATLAGMGVEAPGGIA